MKQRITQSQFEELSGPAQLHYVAWAVTKCQETGDHTIAYRSIGHLIQFLDEHITGWWRIERSSTKDAWRVQAEYVNFDDEGSPELCNALWAAVKWYLEAEHEEQS